MDDVINTLKKGKGQKRKRVESGNQRHDHLKLPLSRDAPPPTAVPYDRNYPKPRDVHLDERPHLLHDPDAGQCRNPC